MGRPAGSLNQIDKAARKILTDAQFNRGIKLHRGQLEVLDLMAHGGYRPRNASAILGALRLKMDYGYSRPEQRHELTGAFTVNVTSVLPGPPGSRLHEAKVAASRTLDATDVEREHANSTRDNELAAQRPISVITETQQSVEIPTDSQVEPSYVNPLTEPSLIEAGALVASTEPIETSEARRERQRREWLSDPVAHPEVAE